MKYYSEEARETAIKRRQITALSISLLCILYITLFSRAPSFTRSIHLDFFWSFTTSSGHWKQIILNICLFIPLGYFLKVIFTRRSRWFTLIAVLLVSIGIEVTQFLTYRGMLDVDDLISNCLGAGIGVEICTILEKRKQSGLKEKWISGGMLFASILGCVIVSLPAARLDSTAFTEQFDFKIESISITSDIPAGKEIRLEGKCKAYGRPTPNYILFLDGEPMTTVIEDVGFVATATVPDEKAEIQIRFKGYDVISTGTFLRPTVDGVSIEYVAGDVTEPKGVPDTAILKAYSTDFDTFVYQNGQKLLWFIGWTGLDSDTEIIYHLRTNTPELLPENRVKSGFDNRGFRVKAEKVEKKEIEGSYYRVFDDIIPDEYNVTAVIVGFNTNGIITWIDSFRVNR